MFVLSSASANDQSRCSKIGLASSQQIVFSHSLQSRAEKACMRFFHCVLLVKHALCDSAIESLQGLRNALCRSRDVRSMRLWNTLFTAQTKRLNASCSMVHQNVLAAIDAFPSNHRENDRRWKIRFMFVEKLSKRCCITLRVL